MDLSIAEQTTSFLLAGALGIALSIFYDLLRVLRRRIGFSPITALTDGLFWLISAAAFLWFTMGFMAGDFRLFVILGAALGAILYFLTLSIPILTLLNTVIDLVLFLFRQIIRPVAAFFRLFRLFYRNIKKSVINRFKIIRKKCMIREYVGVRLKRRGK